MKKSEKIKKWQDFVKENLTSLESMSMVEKCKISHLVSAKTNIFEKDIELNENDLRKRLRNNAILKKSLVELNNKVESCEKANILFYDNVNKKLQSGTISFDSVNELRQCAVTESKKRNGQLNGLLSAVANDTKIYEKEKKDIILSKEIIDDVKIMVEKYKELLESIDAEIDQQIRSINFQPKVESNSENEKNVFNEPEVEKPIETNEQKESEIDKPPLSEHNEINTEMTDLSVVTETPSEYEKDIEEENNLVKSDKEKNMKIPKKDVNIKQKETKSKGNKVRTSQSKENKIKSKKQKVKKNSTSEKSKSEAKSLEVPPEVVEEKPIVNPENEENKTEKNHVKSSSCCGPKNVEVKPQEVNEVIPEVVEEAPIENDVVSEKVKKKKRPVSKNRTKSHPRKRSNKKGTVKSRSKSDPLKSRKKPENIKRKSGKAQMKGKRKTTEKPKIVKQAVIGNVLIEEPITDDKKKSVEEDKNKDVNESTLVVIEADKSENLLVEPVNNQESEPIVDENVDQKEFKAESPEEPMVAMDGNQFQEEQEPYHSVTVEIKDNIKPVKPIKILEVNELLNKIKESEKRYVNMLENLKKQKTMKDNDDDKSLTQQTQNSDYARVSQEIQISKSYKAQNSEGSKKPQDMSIKQGNKGHYSDVGKITKDMSKNQSERAHISEAGKKSQDVSINQVDKGQYSDNGKISKEIPKDKPLPYFNKDFDNSKFNKNCFKSHKPDILQFIDNNPLGDETKYDFRPIVKGVKLRYDYKRLVLQSKKENDDINEKKKLNANKLHNTISRTVSASNDSCIVMELTPNTEEKDEKSSEIELQEENLNNITKIYK